ncbi:MAG TPA: hypothetical protein VK466_03945 [Terriglobales bacterium]|nr:hypothetical protein [Terriglobales bacterium]
MLKRRKNPGGHLGSECAPQSLVAFAVVSRATARQYGMGNTGLCTLAAELLMTFRGRWHGALSESRMW